MATKVKTFKNFLLPNRYLDSIIILQECSLDTGLQNSFKKNYVKKHGFYGRLIFLLWYKVKSLKNFFSKTIHWISLLFCW